VTGAKVVHKDFGNGMQLWVRPSQLGMDDEQFMRMNQGQFDELQNRAISDKMGTLGHHLYAVCPAAPYFL